MGLITTNIVEKLQDIDERENPKEFVLNELEAYQFFREIPSPIRIDWFIEVMSYLNDINHPLQMRYRGKPIKVIRIKFPAPKEDK